MFLAADPAPGGMGRHSCVGPTTPEEGEGRERGRERER